MIKPVVGEVYEHTFSFTQQDVIRFSEVTGDINPVHLNAAYAAQTPFKKPIMHGFLSGSIFSKVFGTIFPGEGTIYLMQQLIFKRPMFTDHVYVARFSIAEIDLEKFTLLVNCKIVDPEGKICLEGDAKLLNKRVFEEK
jgi:acyl dehydratase